MSEAEAMEWENGAADDLKRARRRTLLAFAVVLSLPGCNRWRPNTPLEVKVREPPELFPRLLAALRANGYAVAEQDPSAGYVRVAAKTVSSTPVQGGFVAAPGSWFSIQIQGGKLVLRASGYLVRENDTIRRNSLDDEMQQLAEQLRSVLGEKR
jgi:hypothetical protein